MLAVGEPVTFTATVTVPPRAGKVVAMQFHQDRRPPVVDSFGDVSFGKPGPVVKVELTRTYSVPGVYFPALRATSQREGDPDTPFARVDNIGRVRVVVQ